jgi:transcriptional regulator with XRE-family HTH domain
MPTNPSPDPRTSMWAWIARDLRIYRQRRGLSGQAVAMFLSVGRSSISRLENNQERLDEKQAAILDKAWDTGGHFGLLVWYAAKGHDPDWFRQHVHIESRSSIIKIWELAWVPGLLQTEEYARANLKAGGVRDVEAQVEARMLRQALLEKEDPPVLWVLIWEPVLEVSVGGREVMKRQLRHLLDVSESPNINIRVVPKAAGPHPGLDGAFKLMTVASGEVAYIEAPGPGPQPGGRLVPSAEEVRSYAIRYDRIGQEGLPPSASRELIARFMEATP